MKTAKKRKNPLRANETVRYNTVHYKWLVSAARWPYRSDRVTHIGVVWEDEVDGVVVVRWAGSEPGTHFAVNLERCSG